MDSFTINTDYSKMNIHKVKAMRTFVGCIVRILPQLNIVAVIYLIKITSNK